MLANENSTNSSHDVYSIGNKTYTKAEFGPKAWATILEKSPGRFVDVLMAKFESVFSEKSKKIDKAI
ncbi:hypothetical protein A3J90_01185 [candidate division WOR-1 bacterium RIFOXYC2_FULL_37_10]|uniref:Uncharacterized protein n=1 Tax=candidate division WOR-1 bacterium RIFOXYB2_FULL_37_13 TaxID=1802579 RepID=A0A1F4SSV6_UNCSA|nr:MAG: hypothetical protein A2246_05485 [candidate division WOR-1 bacterium RIFOXYA2_FULL_37_7]OGC23522.1 MAG: hypothetical protein A2310_02850 [candidate division WOR-1 bacterium RIFOXYB2_FULL_37_13]OGC35735.1 MAG: hypothetical protein A3J90_01185 [candidate division WOR-1 bacterium RIFOXYC2_FULL_37_10]